MGVFAPQYIQIDVNVLLDTEEDTAIDVILINLIKISYYKLKSIVPN